MSFLIRSSLRAPNYVHIAYNVSAGYSRNNHISKSRYQDSVKTIEQSSGFVFKRYVANGSAVRDEHNGLKNRIKELEAKLEKMDESLKRNNEKLSTTQSNLSSTQFAFGVSAAVLFIFLCVLANDIEKFKDKSFIFGVRIK